MTVMSLVWVGAWVVIGAMFAVAAWADSIDARTRVAAVAVR